MQITTSNRIGRTLMDAREGDRFKIRTDDGYYLKENVSRIQDDVVGHTRELVLGPEDGPHLLVYVDDNGESIGKLNSYHVFALGPDEYGYRECGEVTELIDLRGV